MPLVEYSVENSVALVVLNRPPVNALSAELLAELGEAFARAEDRSVRALVVTGNPHFAAGADLKSFRAEQAAGGDEQLGARLGRVVRDLEMLQKPTIAAVRGFALGGGLELALGADFRYLSEDARVGQPEIKLGLIPGAGGTQRLPRIVGYQRAKEMIFSGRELGAQEAGEIGLADRVVAGPRLLEAALADARGWAAGPTAAYAAAKRALTEALRLPLDAGLEAERRAFRECFRTSDAREGIGSFVEKRRPSFGGS